MRNFNWSQFTVSPVYHSNEHETVANVVCKIDLVYHLFFVCVCLYVIDCQGKDPKQLVSRLKTPPSMEVNWTCLRRVRRRADTLTRVSLTCYAETSLFIENPMFTQDGRQDSGIHFRISAL